MPTMAASAHLAISFPELVEPSFVADPRTSFFFSPPILATGAMDGVGVWEEEVVWLEEEEGAEVGVGESVTVGVNVASKVGVGVDVASPGVKVAVGVASCANENETIVA